MSDSISKIIPTKSNLKWSSEVTDKIVQWVKANYPGDVFVRNSDKIEFVN